MAVISKLRAQFFSSRWLKAPSQASTNSARNQQAKPQAIQDSATRGSESPPQLAEARRAFWLKTADATLATWTKLHNLTTQHVIENGGRRYLANKDLATTVVTDFVEFAWSPWKFSQAKFWAHLAGLLRAGDALAAGVVREYLQAIAESNGLQLPADIAKFTELRLSEGHKLHLAHFGPLPELLALLYRSEASDRPTSKPNLENSSYSKAPHRRWLIAKNRWQCLERFLRQFQRRATPKPPAAHYDLLYTLTRTHAIQSGLRAMFAVYNESIAGAVSTEIPAHYWRNWNFVKTPANWWPDLNAIFVAGDPIGAVVVRDALDDLLEKYNFQGIDSLFADDNKLLRSVSKADRKRLEVLGPLADVVARLTAQEDQKGGGAREFIGSVAQVDWTNDAEARRSRLDQIRGHLDPSPRHSLGALYKIATMDFAQHYARGLLEVYGDSTTSCVAVEYPEHAWQHWMFDRIPEGWWSAGLAPLFRRESADIVAETAVRSYVDHLAQLNEITTLESWYRLTMRNIGTTTATRLRDLGGLAAVLWRLYPHHPWQFSRFSNTGKRGSQRDVLEALKIGFPDQEIVEEADVATLKFGSGGLGQEELRYDIAIPRLRMIVEFHGVQHYHRGQPISFGTAPAQISQSDTLKYQLAQQNGYTVVEVPHWWNLTADALLATIQLRRPDINVLPHLTTPQLEKLSIPSSNPKPRAATKRR